MLISTNALSGDALDWAVAICEGYTAHFKPTEVVYTHPNGDWHHNGNWRPSLNWVQGGPIIDREDITLLAAGKAVATPWASTITGTCKTMYSGPTPLIAAMRCFVASKMGDSVDVPDILLSPPAPKDDGQPVHTRRPRM